MPTNLTPAPLICPCRLGLAPEGAPPTGLVSPKILSADDGFLGNFNIFCAVPVCHIYGVQRFSTGRVKLEIVLPCTVQDKTPNSHSANRDSMENGRAFPSDVQWLVIIDKSGGSTKSHWFAGEAGMHNHQSPSEDGTSMPRWIRPGSTIIKGQAFQAILP